MNPLESFHLKTSSTLNRIKIYERQSTSIRVDRPALIAFYYLVFETDIVKLVSFNLKREGVTSKLPPRIRQ